MAGAVEQLWLAARLRLLASGQVDLTDEGTLAKVGEILGPLEPAERSAVAAKAVEMGADAATIQALLGITGEVITVTANAPKKRAWWPWILGGVAALGLGVWGLRRRRKRRALSGSSDYSRTPAELARLRLLRQISRRPWFDYTARTVIAPVAYQDAASEQRRLQAHGFDVALNRADEDQATLVVRIDRGIG